MTWFDPDLSWTLRKSHVSECITIFNSNCMIITFSSVLDSLTIRKTRPSALWHTGTVIYAEFKNVLAVDGHFRPLRYHVEEYQDTTAICNDENSISKLAHLGNILLHVTKMKFHVYKQTKNVNSRKCLYSNKAYGIAEQGERKKVSPY